MIENKTPEKKLTHRYVAWLLLEAATPLAIGSGRESLTLDRLVARNAGGWPYIPGTGLAGALRAAMVQRMMPEALRDLFGYAENDLPEDEIKKRKKEEKPTSSGSRLVINSAHPLAADGQKVLEGLVSGDGGKYELLLQDNLPERDHVRINERGAAAKGGKFDTQLCPKGARFACTLELSGTDADEEEWKWLLDALRAHDFRLGGGTRKGFGALKIETCLSRIFDLRDKDDLQAYLEKHNTLERPKGKGWKEQDTQKQKPGENWIPYKLKLTPRNFFFFGSGRSDADVDDTYKTETVLTWDAAGQAQIAQNWILIPATSVKGALRHRLAFHYNKRLMESADKQDLPTAPDHMAQLEALWQAWQNKLADKPGDHEDWEQAKQEIEAFNCEPEQTDAQAEDVDKGIWKTEDNPAVRALFGYAVNDKASGGKEGRRGCVLMSDIFLPDAGKEEKIFDHVRIDRFTGGASDHALFQEKTVRSNADIILEMWVHEAAFGGKDGNDIKQAWEATIADLCEGCLPLGGKTTKGHGFFTAEKLPQ